MLHAADPTLTPRSGAMSGGAIAADDKPMPARPKSRPRSSDTRRASSGAFTGVVTVWATSGRNLRRTDRIPSHVGDADAGVTLVAPVHRDEVGGERLDLVSDADAAAVHPSHPRDRVGERLDEVAGLPVVAQDQDVGLHPLHLGLLQQ